MNKLLAALLGLWLSVCTAAAASNTVFPVAPGTGTTSPFTMITSGPGLYPVHALCDTNNNCLIIQGGGISIQGFGAAGTPVGTLMTVQGTAGMSPIIVNCASGCSAATTPTSVNIIQLNGVAVGPTLPVSAFVSNATALGPAAPAAANPVTPSNQPVGTGALATTQVTVGNSSQIVAPRTGVAGTGRVAVTVVNTTTTSIWVGNSGVTSLTGLFLPPIIGASVTLNTTAGIFGTATSSSNVSAIETF